MSLLPRTRGGIAALLVACTMAVLTGCAGTHYPVNPPLGEQRQQPGYVSRSLVPVRNSDSLSVFLAFSGGGYRAAAMAFAALEVLRDTEIESDNEARSLLQEVDFISAVSGGSLAAAYYAVHPQRFFPDFETRVLDVDLQGELLARALSPAGLWRQTSSRFGRGDLLQELLDERVFDGVTYGAIARQRPMVTVHATDMRTGARFEFNQDQFDRLCSDLDAVPVSRAVATSMAVPVLLSPITFWNHGHDCPAQRSTRRAADVPTMPPVPPMENRYIHLVDGGLVDNTGLSAPLEAVAKRGGLTQTYSRAGLTAVSTRVFIVVNAQTPTPAADDDRPETPGLWRQLRSAIDVPIDRQSDASVQALGDALRLWQAEGSATGEDTFVIEVSVSRARAADAARRVHDIPTALRISREQLLAIRHFVRSEFAASPAWRRLLERLQRPPGRTVQAAIGDAGPVLR